MTERPAPSPPRRTFAVGLLLAAALLGAVGCGEDAGDGPKPQTGRPTAHVPSVEVPRFDADGTKDAAGTVSVCGATSTMRSLLPTVRRFDLDQDRLQASTLGFPDGGGRPLAAFRERQRRASRDCDVVVAERAADVLGLAADGGVYDIAEAVGRWTVPSGAPPLRPVPGGERVLALPLRAGSSPGVLVLSVHGRNPAGGLEVLRVLAGARVGEA